jgi:hypothetical protein
MMSAKRLSTIFKPLAWAEIDRAVVYALLSKGWEMVASVGTMLLVAYYFSPELQGYFHTFANIIAFQLFAELGLGIVIAQFASHEWAKLRLDGTRAVVGDKVALSRLRSLTRIGLRWYPLTALIVAVTIATTGYLFFSYSGGTASWQAPWLAFCALAGLNICFLPFWSIMEGCNQLSDLYMYRLIMGIVSNVAGWIAIVAGAGLWIGPIMLATGLIWASIFLLYRFRSFFASLLKEPERAQISWSHELWPMQWRMAVSWLSGFLNFGLFTPVLFWFHGPVLAGQMGMSLFVVRGLHSLSVLWVSTKAPQFGVLVARRDYANLDRLFRKALVVCFSVAATGFVIFMTLLLGLNAMQHPLADRFLAPLPTALLLFATVLVQLELPQCYYLRAHKREPLMLFSIASGVLVAGSNLIMGALFAETGVALGYLAVNVLFAIPVCNLIWWRCRRDWHAEPDQSIAPAPDAYYPTSPLM